MSSEREQAFLEYVQNGGKVDAADWMPDDYRTTAVKTVSFQALAEIFGAMVQTAALAKAPTLLRKLIFTAKAQDEKGHGYYLLRLCEDLGLSREQIIEEFLAGKRKVLSMFHYHDEDWHHFAVWSMLGNNAAITQFETLVEGSYLPYTRVLRRIMKEESFHYHQAINLTRTLLQSGNPEQIALLQAGLDTWWFRILEYFGPAESEEMLARNPGVKWRIKVADNETLRQRWLTRMVKVMEGLAPLRIPDPNLRWDEAEGRWLYSPIDWDAFKTVMREGGPDLERLRGEFQRNYDRHRWVRDATA